MTHASVCLGGRIQAWHVVTNPQHNKGPYTEVWSCFEIVIALLHTIYFLSVTEVNPKSSKSSHDWVRIKFA